MTELCHAAQLVVAVGAYVRGAMVVLLALRTFLRRRHFASLRIDSGFLLTAPEPILLIAITYLLHSRAADLSGATAFALAAAFSGAALVLLGWLLVLWTFASWPSIFVGHAVLRDHHLVTNGAYGFVRHPVYLGAFLIWLGVGVGFASGWALLVAILYVIPAYLLYVRDEEAMLDEAFGDAYRSYRGSVPRLIPQLRRRPVATSGAGTLLLLLLSVVPVYAGEHPGQSLYLRYCAACHGRQGRGDGPVAPALGEKPTDLTQLAATHGEESPCKRSSMRSTEPGRCVHTAYPRCQYGARCSDQTRPRPSRSW